MRSTFWIEHADQARALTRQRNKRERTRLDMKFRRNVSVRPRVSKIERQRSLRIRAPMTPDASGCAAERVLAVSADHQPSAHDSVGETDRSAVVIRRDRERGGPHAWNVQAGGAALERSHQVTVFDIVAESIQADFRRGEMNFRCAPEAARVVDDADCSERRRVCSARIAYAKRLQGRDRSFQESGGAMILLGRRRDDQRVDPRRGERDRADESSRSATDDGGFDGLGLVRSAHRITMRIDN